uniref:Uncharacterized protein LOC100183672 n=1 Tax=Phallusia mammillata TaxID=59560 RepID=A0A6F9DIM8_9ASCI|nr:uncharacterized protein LOC100183672 [Phallusia mammillata]
MADISRIASPMSLCEEDLFDTSKKVEKRKQELRNLQKVRPAPFLIGSIQKVNERICNLDSELSLYDSKLAIESRSTMRDEVYDPTTGTFQQKSTRRSTRSAKDREDKETNKFAGAFSQESGQKIDIKSRKKKEPTQQSDAPRLVELQQYPGFSPSRLTPLPHSLAATTVLDHVISAQDDLPRKPKYRAEVRRMLYSKTQRAVLQDTFWWFFLDKYHPDVESQSKLFKRIARNFVTFLLMSQDPKFRNTFFMTYASMLAQSVYSAFCLAFPQSWRQFDEPMFKENLIFITTKWVSGIQPSPRQYEKWNYQALEPAKMRKEVKTVKEKKPGFGGKLSPIGSSASTKTSTAHSRASNKGILKMLGGRSEAQSAVSSLKTKSNETNDKSTLSPITEVPAGIDEESVHPKTRSSARKHEESCAVGRSAEFERCAFNIYGRSPLLSEFLQQNNLERRSGCDHLIRRTQIETYPSPEAPTYQDFLQVSGKKIRETTESYNRIHNQWRKSCSEFTNRMTEETKAYNTKAQKVLSKPRQVRYLSNLLLMEMKRDRDEMNLVGASAALQSALAAETAN